jgi:hypothetical protein
MLFDQALKQGLPPDGVLLVVDVPTQRLLACTRRGVWRVFRISTAARGLGSRPGSYATPPGWHRVAHRLGAGAPPGQVFRSRRRTRRVLPPAAWRSAGNEDLILTRILWLAGLEPGVNRGAGVDTQARFIYLHGTNHEQRLGEPVSHGCIRLGNRAIIALFAWIGRRETWCWIGEQEKKNAIH